MVSTRRLITLSFLILFLSVCSIAGTYIEYQQRIDPITVSGKVQPVRNNTTRLWIDDQRLLSEDTGTKIDILVRLDQKTITFIDQKNKTYSICTLPLQFPPEVRKLIQTLQLKTQVTKSGETRQIQGRPCEKIQIVLEGYVNLSITAWGTKSVKIPLKNYYELLTEMVAYSPAIQTMVKQLQSMDLFLVEQEVTGEIMGTRTHTRQTLTNIQEMAIPETRFQPPAGYRSIPMDFARITQ